MPIEAEAYIRGDIPTLSRGGSWLPNLDLNATGHQTNSVLQRPPQTAYQQAQSHSHNFAPSNAWANPLFFHQAPYPPSVSGSGSGYNARVPFPNNVNQQNQKQGKSVTPPRSVTSAGDKGLAGAGGTNSTSDGRKKEGLVGPVEHTGWLETRSQRSHVPSESYYSPSAVSRKSKSRTTTIRQSQSIHPFFDDHLPIEQGKSWEEQGGAPKPILPEPNYSLKKESLPRSRLSSSQSSSVVSATSLYTHSRHSPQTASPYKRVAEILPPTPTPPHTREREGGGKISKVDVSADLNHVGRHGGHHHSFDSQIFSPKPKKVSSDDLGRSAQLNSRLVRLSLEGRRHRTPDPDGTPSFQGVNSPLNPNHTAAPPAKAHASGSGSGRPALTRRHTSDNYEKSPPITVTTSSAAPAAAVPPPHRAVEGLKRSRQLSSPISSSSLKTSQYEDKVPNGNGSTIDFTATTTAARTHISAVPTPSSPSSHSHTHTHSRRPKLSGRERRQSSLSIAASDSVSQQFQQQHIQAGYLSRDSQPAGYISPIADEGYDRYAAHPAAPAPDRGDRYLQSSQASTPTTIPSQSSRGEYIPIGYARPTREIPWNRTGPAMKTHGIAWLRDGEVQSLPGTPQGPRWEIARPPRAEHVQGGSWWESGGEGSEVAVAPW